MKKCIECDGEIGKHYIKIMFRLSVPVTQYLCSAKCFNVHCKKRGKAC